MAEEKTIPENKVGEGLNRDDMTTLRYVLQHVRGSSPSSYSPFAYEEVSEKP